MSEGIEGVDPDDGTTYDNGGMLTPGTVWVSFPEETHLLTFQEMADLMEVLQRKPSPLFERHKSTPYDDLQEMLRFERHVWATTAAHRGAGFPLTVGAF